MIRFIKECVWSFTKRRRIKQTLEYMKGDIVDRIPEKDEAEMVKAKYAEYIKDGEKVSVTESYIEGTRVHPQGQQQVVPIETKDIRTAPVRKVGKTTDDNKSDKV